MALRNVVSGVRCFLFLGLLGCFFSSPNARAQWATEEIDVAEGWNAVFLHVDPSHLDLNTWVGGNPSIPISEIWRWESPSIAQYVDDPSDSEIPPAGWTRWVSTNAVSDLTQLVGDTAYLVKADSAFTWSVKGKPVPPRSTWNIRGLNLMGFPTDRAAPPEFDEFLEEAPALQSIEAEIYRYSGLSLTNNPVLIPSLLYRNIEVKRGEAFWIRSGSVFNDYFGPFEIVLSGAAGVNFYENLSTYRFRIRNLSPNPLSVTMALRASESVPVGETPIAGNVPLLVRGGLDTNTHTRTYTVLPEGSNVVWALAARDEEGSEVEVVLGMDRSVITEDVGELLAGILTFTDSAGHTEIDLPVSGVVDSDAGLWVGDAQVTQVGQYLKTYQSGASVPIVTTNGTTVTTNDLVISSGGNYVVSNLDTSMTDVSRMFPLRLIIHNPENSDARLLQQVYYGFADATNVIISTDASALDPSQFESARRVSASHLPWTEENPGWSFGANLENSASITTTVTTVYNDHRSNPFLHTYHPDHDNLDSSFEAEQVQGAESYTVEREIQLHVDALGTNFSSRVAGSSTYTGSYEETLRIIGLSRGGGTNDTRVFETRGVFRLDRISSIPELTVP